MAGSLSKFTFFACAFKFYQLEHMPGHKVTQNFKVFISYNLWSLPAVLLNKQSWVENYLEKSPKYLEMQIIYF